MDSEDRGVELVPISVEPVLPAGALDALERSLATTGRSGRGPRSLARRLGALTSVLVLGVVAALGFIGGVQVQKRQGDTTPVAAAAGGGAAARARAAGATTTTAAAGPSSSVAGGAGGGGAGGGNRPGGGQGGPAGTGAGAAAAGGGAAAAGGAAGAQGRAGGGGAGAAAAGTVKLIDGANIYVTDASGNVVKVVTTPSSRFTKTGAGSIQDVRPGDTVIVQGQKGDDGIVTATAVANSGAATP